MITLNVNGTNYQVNAGSDMPLLWVIRDILGLTGTKYGCGIEQCGACTVLVDGHPQKSCDMDATEAVGRKITTIEGLSATGTHPVQLAWIANQVPQCGYCQSGMILCVAAALARNPKAKATDITGELENICACGTYQRIRNAVKSITG
ncbi:MAG: (2Fe-2S)-binding protein [Proteobacteria bacterium]|nr:(2Fe-2S)-binding protein [Pseudomonadota bacterium]